MGQLSSFSFQFSFDWRQQPTSKELNLAKAEQTFLHTSVETLQGIVFPESVLMNVHNHGSRSKVMQYKRGEIDEWMDGSIHR